MNSRVRRTIGYLITIGLLAGSTASGQSVLTPSEGAGGDSAVSAQPPSAVGRTGSAAYNYSFQLPPSRAIGPALSLTYSSSGPVRGTDIAHGWTLNPLPSIRRDVRLEASTAFPVFTVDMGAGVQQLSPVVDDVTAHGGNAYRTITDTTFTRFEFVRVIDASHWYAYTTSGLTYRFDEVTGSEWRLASVQDRWQNEALYHWEAVTWQGGFVDVVLTSIEYTQNSGAGLGAQVQVRLSYTMGSNCPFADPHNNEAPRLPIGAFVDYSTGLRRIRGILHLDSVRSEVRDSATATWRPVRRWQLHYKHNMTVQCRAVVSPRYQLTEIEEVGIQVIDGVRREIAAPTISFTYGAEPFSTGLRRSTLPLPADSLPHLGVSARRCGDEFRSPAINWVFMDVDGDGLADLVQSGGDRLEISSCTGKWYRNLGGGFLDPGGQALPLPQAGGPFPACSLLGSVSIEGGRPQCLAPEHDGHQPYLAPVLPERWLSYRWVDIDGDGALDLITGGVFSSASQSFNVAAPLCYAPSCLLEANPSRCQTRVPCKQAYSARGDAYRPEPTLSPQDLACGWPEDQPQPAGVPFYPIYPAQTCPNGFLWQIHYNVGGSFAPGQFVCAPVALGVNGPTGPEQPMKGKPSAPFARLFDLIDMDADGLPDIVAAGFIDVEQSSADRSTFCPRGRDYPDKRMVFQVFPGFGNGVFSEPQLWLSPAWPTDCGDSDPMWNALVDVNGDGLPDLLHESSGKVYVAFNRGHGFDPDFIALIGSGPTGMPPRNPPPQCEVMKDRTWLIFHDYDRDGIADFGDDFGSGLGFSGSLPGNVPRKPAFQFSDLDVTGDGFNDAVSLVSMPGSFFTNLQIDNWEPPDNGAGGLLVDVANGIGGHTRFHYAPMSDFNVVRLNHSRPAYAEGFGDWIQPSRRPQGWVVRQIDSDDGNGVSSSATYLFEDPVYVGEGPWQTPKTFRGFQAVTTTLDSEPDEAGPPSFVLLGHPQNLPKVFERYNYRVDPAGVRDYRVVRDDLGNKLIVDRKSFAVESVLDPDQTIRFPHVQSVEHVECPPTANEACDDQSSFRTTTTYYFAPTADGGLWLNNRATVSTTTPFGAQLQREAMTDYLVINSGPDYLVLPKRRVSSGFERVQAPLGPPPPEGGTPTFSPEVNPPPRSRVEFFYDGSDDVNRCGILYGACRGALTKRRSYREPAATVSANYCADETVCEDHGYVYDGNVGVLVAEIKPSDLKAARGDPNAAVPYVTYGYDANYLYPATVRSVLGHTVTQVVDIGTGELLSRAGPAWRFVVDPGCVGLCLGRYSYATHSFTYDALGRLLSESIARDALDGGFTTDVVRHVRYPNFNFVSTLAALDWSRPGESRRWTQVQVRSDGFGRAIERRDNIEGFRSSDEGGLATPGEGAWAIHRISYDKRGRLKTVTGPDPSDDAAVVTQQYFYDVLGRPAATTLENANALLGRWAVHYLPWERTITDADNRNVREVVDGLGRLRIIEEGEGNELARTTYGYDSNDQLEKVVDADGYETRFTNDGEGRRTATIRPGGRTWRYFYNPDGKAAGLQDPDGRVTSFVYDAIGRLSDEIPTVQYDSDALASAKRAGQLGIGRVHYVYDPVDARLSRVEMYRPSSGELESLYASIDYRYDAPGHETSETWTLDMQELGPQRTFTASSEVTPLGKPLETTFPNGVRVTWSYDGRGAVDTIRSTGQILAHYVYGLAGAIREVHHLGGTGQPEQVNSYVYDSVGRVRSETLNAASATPPQTLRRSYDYRPDGDVGTVTIDDQLSDGHLLAALTLDYDSLHRIKSARKGPASGTLPLSYDAAVTYGRAGSPATVTIAGAIDLPPRVGWSYEYGQGVAASTAPVTGGQADVQAVAALVTPDGHQADFWYDLSGNLTDRLVPARPRLNAHFVYDTRDQVRAVTNEQGLSENYFYQGRQRFLTVTDPNSWRLTLGDSFEVDHTGSSEVMSAYINGVARLSTINCSINCPVDVSILHGDRRGDVIAVLDGAGALRSHMAYGAFGEVLYKYDPQEAWLRRVGGKEQDATTQLSYYGNRYYDPFTLRWTTADPLYRAAPETGGGHPQHLNLYSYSLNNPLRYVDVSGLDTDRGNWWTDFLENVGFAWDSFTASANQAAGGYVEAKTGVRAQPPPYHDPLELPPPWRGPVPTFAQWSAAHLPQRDYMEFLIYASNYQFKRLPGIHYGDLLHDTSKVWEWYSKMAASLALWEATALAETPALVSEGFIDGTSAARIIAEARASLQGVGQGRNVAVADVSTGEFSGRLVSVSKEHEFAGALENPPQPRIFETTVDRYERFWDSEPKIFEFLSNRISPDASGTIRLVSQRRICLSCDGVIRQFIARHPNISIIVGVPGVP